MVSATLHWKPDTQPAGTWYSRTAPRGLLGSSTLSQVVPDASECTGPLRLKGAGGLLTFMTDPRSPLFQGPRGLFNRQVLPWGELETRQLPEQADRMDEATF